MRRLHPILAFVVMLAFSVSSRPAALEPPTPQRVIKWPTTTIKISLSTSLTTASASIMAGSDVIGALQRALETWSAVSSFKFEIVTTPTRSISTSGAGDGINLITVASTAENLAIFKGGNNAAQTRVQFDRVTGLISEADVVINPYPRDDNGDPILFSTDGTPGTYDLESTFAHEVGHVLGLNHSNVIAATMQETQGVNGMFGKPAFEARSLSEADRVAILALYGPCENLGPVAGQVFKNLPERQVAVGGAQVWIEEAESGRVVASNLVNANGKFNIGCLPAGQYRALVDNVDVTADGDVPSVVARRITGRQRVFRRTEVSSFLSVTAGQDNPLSFLLAPIQNGTRTLRPRLYGINGELSTVPITADAGTRVRIYIGGLGVDQVEASGLKLSSPFMVIDPTSLQVQSGSTPVISFVVTIPDAALECPGLGNGHDYRISSRR